MHKYGSTPPPPPDVNKQPGLHTFGNLCQLTARTTNVLKYMSINSQEYKRLKMYAIIIKISMTEYNLLNCLAHGLFQH